MRLSASKSSASSFYSGLGEQLYDLSGARPALDLNFASNGSLVDSVTGKSLVTHTRASNATYVDGDGIIKDAVTNLALYSEELNNSYWSRINASVTSNQATAPDGTLTADKIVDNTSTANHGINKGFTNFGQPVTYSVYAKAGEKTQVSIGSWDGSSGMDAYFDLTTGAITSSNFTDSSIENVGNGWYRCRVSRTPAGNYNFAVYIVDSSGRTYAGDGTSGIYVWGAQLEESSTAGEYVKTTSTINSAPRFDHNPTTGESLGLLVEESRTNLAFDSEDLSTSTWNVNGSATVTSGYTSPAGDSSAYLVQNATSVGDSSGNDNLRKNQGTNSSFGSLSAGAYTISGYVKGNGATTEFTPRIRLAASSVDSQVAVSISSSWQRFTVTVTTTVTSDLRMIFAADSSDGFYLWGVQVEAGSFPTSYIRTEGSTATRSADVASITGTNFSSWYNQTEGTVFSASRHKAVTARTLAFTDGTYNNAMQQYLLSNTAAMDSYISNSWQGSGGANITFVSDQQFKVISTIQTDSGVTAADGTLGTVDTSYGIPTVDRLLIGQSRSSDNTNGTIARLTYWPTRLSNDTLQTITR